MKHRVHQLLAGIVKDLGVDNAVIVVEAAENPVHGDYTSNIAMVLAGHLHAPPMKIAGQIADTVKAHQKNSLIQWLDRVEAAPPGFINFFVSEATLRTELAEVLKEKERYGALNYHSVTQVIGLGSDQKKGKNDTGKSRNINYGEGNAKTGQKSINVPRTNTASAEIKEKTVKSASFGNKIIPGDAEVGISPKVIMVEFAHPNTHKAFHIGHLRNITTGESIVRLLESQGHTVVRANYQGDVGMHIAKALYALINVSPFKEKVGKVTGIKNRVEFLGKAYAAGSKAFEESDEMKKIIGDLNKKIYDRDPSLMELYKETRQWSLDYFETIYKTVGSRFDRYYFESEVFEKGRATVLEALKKGIFEKSDGAIIFPGEKYGLHNRVFVTGDGNATYEAKDIGLARLQFDEYHPDLVIHCVGPEQASYFQVLFQALAQVFPDTAGKEYHLKYGWVKLKTGKMSSRLGNVVLGEWLIDEVKKAINAILEQSISKDKEVNHDLASEAIAIGAIKYSFLKVSTPTEIAFDLQESINTNGDSGPYLQYAYARCRSVIRKAADLGFKIYDLGIENDLKSYLLNRKSQPLMNEEERLIARRIMQFSDIVTAAAQNYAPNTLCTYLFQLAQEFNLFYAKHTILGAGENRGSKGSVLGIMEDTNTNNPNTKYETLNTVVTLRVTLTAATAQVLKNGLYLLGIQTLERM